MIFLASASVSTFILFTSFFDLVSRFLFLERFGVAELEKSVEQTAAFMAVVLIVLKEDCDLVSGEVSTRTSWKTA